LALAGLLECSFLAGNQTQQNVLDRFKLSGVDEGVGADVDEGDERVGVDVDKGDERVGADVDEGDEGVGADVDEGGR